MINACNCFTMHYFMPKLNDDFMTIFYSLSLREFQNAQTMVFTIEEINNRADILPGVSLGYKIYDSCGSIEEALRASLSLVNEGNETQLSCQRRNTVQAIIAETSSTPTIAISSTVGPLHIPVVSFSCSNYSLCQKP